LENTLTQVAQFAVRAIPGADGAGLTLLEEGRSDTIVATAKFVSEIDDIQYGLGQGPCVSAAAEGRTMMTDSLGSDQRWPDFGSQVAGLGVHSALSLPLITAGRVVGAMNIYAHKRAVFTERAAEIGELFAVPAAVAVQNAQVLSQARRLATQLQATLSNRAVIDRAVGIIMSRSGGTVEQAMAKLRKSSQEDHQEISALAQRIVDEAVRLAEARRGG
jgi:GAF domain-containing protein